MISRVTVLISLLRGLIAPLIATHEPPSTAVYTCMSVTELGMPSAGVRDETPAEGFLLRLLYGDVVSWGRNQFLRSNLTEYDGTCCSSSSESTVTLNPKP